MSHNLIKSTPVHMSTITKITEIQRAPVYMNILEASHC